MTDEHDAGDYLAFLRGYAAALNHDAADLAAESSSYAEGVAAATQPVEHTVRYRDFSVEHSVTSTDSGSFSGTLADLLR